MKLSGDFGLKPCAKYISRSVAALGALAIATQANAADIYAPGPGGFKDVPVVVPAPLWTGFYAGINSGTAWSHIDIRRNEFFQDGHIGAPPVCTFVGGRATCFGGDNLNSTNAFGGGQFGYNWQGWGWSNFVFGVEVDLEGVGGNNERTFVGFRPDQKALAVSLKENGGFAGDVTGRLGYTWGNWMLYAKGGFAWFNPDISARATAYSPATGLPIASIQGFDNSTTLTGWTIGGGVEWLLNPNWSVKVEYLFYDFGLNDNWNATYCPVTGAACSTYGSWKVFDHDLTVNTVKLGVNYHLTSGYVPLK